MTKRLIALICALALAGAACGGGDTTEDATAAASEPAPTTELAEPAEVDETPTEDESDPAPEEPAPLTGDQWATQLIDAWDLFQERYTDAAIAYINDFATGPDQVPLAVTLFQSLAPAYEDLLASLPPSPQSAALDAAYAPFVDAVATTTAAAVATLASLEENEEAYITEQAEGPEEGDPNSSYIVLRNDFNETELSVEVACFPVQAAMVDAGLPVLACTPDGGPGEPDDCSVDPLTEATTFERCFLEPGAYDLPVYGSPVSITLPEPVLISTAVGVIDIANETEFLSVQVFATTELVDPTAVVAGEVEATVPLPLDLDEWAAALPVIVEGSGTSTLFGSDVAFVQVRVDIDAALELGGDPVLALIPSDAFLGDVNIPPEMSVTIWSGDQFAIIAFHEGDPAEHRAWVESILTDATLG